MNDVNKMKEHDNEFINETFNDIAAEVMEAIHTYNDGIGSMYQFRVKLDTTPLQHYSVNEFVRRLSTRIMNIKHPNTRVVPASFGTNMVISVVFINEELSWKNRK